MIINKTKQISLKVVFVSIVAILSVLSFISNVNSDESNSLARNDGKDIAVLELQFKALNELLMESFINIQEYKEKKAELIDKLFSVDTESRLNDIRKLAEEGVISKLDYKKELSLKYTKYQEPEFLSFKELKELYLNPDVKGALKEKEEKFYRTPIIDNRPYYRGVKPNSLVDDNLGEFLRVVTWNIEKSLNIKDAIAVFSDEQELRDRIDPAKIKNNEDLDLVLNQRKRLATADIIVLQEMEIGVKRSGYLNAAGELAKKLDMNYTYAPQYLEVDPVQLGIEQILTKEGDVDIEATDYYSVDKTLFKGAFGSAVLSRYPIKKVTLFPLYNQGYDWYSGEVERATFLEKTRRVGAKVTFNTDITREIKRGGRHFFRIDLEVPGIPDNTLTIINIHLEIKCLPEARDVQIAEILGYIKDIKNPVIMLGDFNSAPVDLSPTSVKRMVTRNLKEPTNWLGASVNYLTPIGLLLNTTRGVSNATKNLQNPLAMHVPVVAPNHVKKMFTRIEEFRFDDGGAFDFRGDPEHSVNGKSGKLANANQRDFKGFKTSFKVRRVIAKVIGTFRLDWIFVKSFLKDSSELNGPYMFAPHYGETLSELNSSLYEKISDHDPNVVDLPFLEPKLSAGG